MSKHAFVIYLQVPQKSLVTLYLQVRPKSLVTLFLCALLLELNVSNCLNVKAKSTHAFDHATCQYVNVIYLQQ